MIMTEPIDPIPDDLPDCQDRLRAALERLRDLERQLDEFIATTEDLQRSYACLKEDYLALKRLLFGPRRERLPEAPDQQHLFDADPPPSVPRDPPIQSRLGGRPHIVVAVGSDAGRKPRNTAESPEIAGVPAGVCTARDGGAGAPRTGTMWGFPERDLGARRRPPKPLEREPSEARAVLRVDCARSAGAAARRRAGGRVMHALVRRGLTRRCEDPPAASRHGAPH